MAKSASEAARLKPPYENAIAMFNLGLMFRTGDGVAQDEAETFRLWTEAAKLGVVRAQHGLGEMMRNGIGAKFEKD
jgi:TPR repeat protein